MFIFSNKKKKKKKKKKCLSKREDRCDDHLVWLNESCSGSFLTPHSRPYRVIPRSFT